MLLAFSEDFIQIGGADRAILPIVDIVLLALVLGCGILVRKTITWPSGKDRT